MVNTSRLYDKCEHSKQTSPEISFLGSLEDSIFYSIAISESNTVLPPECSCKNLQGSKEVANNLDLYRSTCNIAVDPHMVPILSTVDTLFLEQTWPLGTVNKIAWFALKQRKMRHLHDHTIYWKILICS